MRPPLPAPSRSPRSGLRRNGRPFPYTTSVGVGLIVMQPVSARLQAHIAREFTEPAIAAEVVRRVGAASDTERVQAAIVFNARGDIEHIRGGAELARLDWRDALMGSGLENSDWETQLDRLLGKPR